MSSLNLRNEILAILSPLLFCFCQMSIGQTWVTLTGRVVSSGDSSIAGASVIIRGIQESVPYGFCISSKEGKFIIRLNIEKPGSYFLQVSHVGFQSVIKQVEIDNEPHHVYDYFFRLLPSIIELKEVIVTTKLPSISMKKDTVEYNAADFKNQEVVKMEDLLRNINGFMVDSRGRISYNGKKVEKILIDGDDPAGGNYAIISKYLGASVIKKIQVINNYTDNRLMRDVQRSDKIAINIVVEEKFKNRISGSIEAGGAVQNHYVTDANLIYLTTKVKLLTFSNANNIGNSVRSDFQYYFNEGSG